MSRQQFCGAIPDNPLYDPEYDMWVRYTGDALLVGASSFGTVECAKTVLAVHAPISFVLLEANAAAEERPVMLNRDPYAAGWMVRVRPIAWEAERRRPVDATAFHCEVEIHFAGPAVRLLVPGVADTLRPWPDVDTSIYHMMRQAANLDVSFRACAMAMSALVGKDEALIPEYTGTVAASAFVARALDPEWSPLVF